MKVNIKYKLFLQGVLSLLTVVFIFGCSTSENQDVVSNFYNLTMADEFNTDGPPDASIWNYNIGTGTNGWGNNELQYYTNRTENVTVQNGILIITAKKEDYNGSAYTSARLTSKNLFEQKYGRFEARIRLPFGQGLWPACGEIDIMEYRGENPTIVLGSVHGPGYSGANAVSKSYELKNDRFDTEFHVFGIEWGPDFINYYVDDVLYNQITPDDVEGQWVFDHPFYIIMNLAVGGNFVAAPNNETVFPQTMLVDYVRVYNTISTN
ncbi:glycoside hydrolase family 16 protein [Aestuariibaculum sediminum]|uniref:Glycoside hydrolase family 16 protein n=1 Tax=Aestuariibaculum sediminum TaxID=2770637 RepID=A0A8J6Q2H6_9FLAO|nr:glycoside hydrolase family 16 protein [Aestuariibaculum sediminum]MBD0831835.1 glycoside hydrolase family 16 protein [Aestuariibaculum sediminum]